MNDPGLHQITEAGPVHDEREIEAVLDVLRNGTLDFGPRSPSSSGVVPKCWRKSTE